MNPYSLLIHNSILYNSFRNFNDFINSVCLFIVIVGQCGYDGNYENDQHSNLGSYFLQSLQFPLWIQRCVDGKCLFFNLQNKIKFFTIYMIFSAKKNSTKIVFILIFLFSSQFPLSKIIDSITYPLSKTMDPPLFPLFLFKTNMQKMITLDMKLNNAF